MNKPNVDELEDFVAWRMKNPDLTLIGYAYHNLSASVAIAFSRLLWPELLMHRGGVFLADSFSEVTFDTWSFQLGGDVQGIERAMNHFHLGDMARSFRELGVQNQQYLIEVVSNCWRCRLKQAYPNLRFRVDVWSEGDGIDHALTFYQSE